MLDIKTDPNDSLLFEVQQRTFDNWIIGLSLQKRRLKDYFKNHFEHEGK